jgi:hypothetical protein
MLIICSRRSLYLCLPLPVCVRARVCVCVRVTRLPSTAEHTCCTAKVMITYCHLSFAHA